jgi:hypothetical protein
MSSPRLGAKRYHYNYRADQVLDRIVNLVDQRSSHYHFIASKQVSGNVYSKQVSLAAESQIVDSSQALRLKYGSELHLRLWSVQISYQDDTMQGVEVYKSQRSGGIIISK